MKVTETIWKLWKEEGKGTQNYMVQILKKLRKSKIVCPGEYLTNKETKMLSTLNKKFLEIGKNLTQIKRGTGISYACINYKVEEFSTKGYITSNIGKGRNKHTHSRERIVKLTEKGYNLMQIWKDIYAFI